MRKELKQLLINSLIEQRNKNEENIIESVQLMASLVFSSADLFERVPSVVVGWEFKGKDLMPFGPDIKPKDDPGPKVEFHPRLGALLHDGLHASSNGGRRFMYRAKGQRLYLFENGDLVPISIYGQVDRGGFYLQKDYEIDFSINIHRESDPTLVTYLFQLMLSEQSESRFIGRDILKILCNIKKPFKRDFLLEYLLIPPDVDTVSQFSTNVRECIWDICLSKEFEDEVGRDDQSRCMNILSEALIPPAPQQIVSFMRRLSVEHPGVSELLERFKQLEVNISAKVEKIGDDIKNFDFWKNLFGQLENIGGEKVSFDSSRANLADLEKFVLLIVDRFKNLVEENGLWKELWDKNNVRRESSAQNLFFLMAQSYCEANDIDLTPEANSGNGPVDFKLSVGYHAKVLVEVKLSTNSKVVHGYETQLEIYKRADGTEIGIFLLIDVGSLGGKLEEVEKIRATLISSGKPASHVKYIDGRKKQSASVRK